MEDNREIINTKGLFESETFEAKRALGGLPESLWESYSAFANKGGGVIALGLNENKDHTLSASALAYPKGLMEEFFRKLPDMVSVNLISADDCVFALADGETIILIKVRAARAIEKPVYIGSDPYSGSYERIGEADIKMSRIKVRFLLFTSFVLRLFNPKYRADAPKEL